MVLALIPAILLVRKLNEARRNSHSRLDPDPPDQADTTTTDTTNDYGSTMTASLEVMTTPLQDGYDDDDGYDGYDDDCCRDYSSDRMAVMTTWTPSPQSAGGLDDGATTMTSASRSIAVSRMLSDHLVTVNDDEVILLRATITALSATTLLPELEDIIAMTMAAAASFGGPVVRRRSSGGGGSAYDPEVGGAPSSLSSSSSSSSSLSSLSSLLSSSSSSSNNIITPPPPIVIPVQHKMLYQSVRNRNTKRNAHPRAPPPLPLVYQRQHHREHVYKSRQLGLIKLIYSI